MNIVWDNLAVRALDILPEQVWDKAGGMIGDRVWARLRRDLYWRISHSAIEEINK